MSIAKYGSHNITTVTLATIYIMITQGNFIDSTFNNYRVCVIGYGV